MARQILKTILQKKRNLTPTLVELTLKLEDPKELVFKTGQFMMLNIPQAEGAKPQLRAYSLASDEREKTHFKLILKYVTGGIGSEYVRGLGEGAPVGFTGPYGKLFFQTPAPEQVLFLCTGAGLSQHYSMLLSQGEFFQKTKFHLLLGVWSEDEIFYREELEELQKKLPNLTFEYVIDQPTAQWKGKRGYVTDCLKNFDLKKSTAVYLCGNPAMIKGAKQWLEEKAFPKEQVFAESFG